MKVCVLCREALDGADSLSQLGLEVSSSADMTADAFGVRGLGRREDLLGAVGGIDGGGDVVHEYQRKSTDRG